jgi:peptidyl-prolyl cis-trans isomerase SurA
MKKGGLFRKSYSDKEVLNELNTKDNQKVKIKDKIFRQGEHPVIDYHVWNTGTAEDVQDQKPYWVKGKIVPPTVKTLDEARGEVIADYQNHLEQKWIEELRNNYNIQINKEVLRKLKENSDK